ncbi:ketoacyl-ACP synthase III [bacterium]|nr:ketoacyl-ACP synthase III [bacterium]
MGASIKKIDIYLPETVLSNDMLSQEFEDLNSEKVEKRTGIRERHVSAENETALDLAERAARNVFEHEDPVSVDFIILCTQSPEYYLPTGACILQDRLGLRNNIGALDISLGCSGFIYGLALAKSLIAANTARRVLLVTSDVMTKHVHPKDRANRTIFGDGASATIIDKSDSEGILHFSLGTDGRGYRNLIVPNGGLRHRYDPDAPDIDDGFGGIRSENHLYMNGPEIFNFTIDAVPKVVADVLEKNKMTMDDLDYVIFHQANKYIVDYLRKKIGIPKEKFYINLLQTGNTVSATIPIGLKYVLEQGIVRSGDVVLVSGFGVGYSWGATVLRI